MRHNRSQRGSARSHRALTPSILRLCSECGSPKLPHTACPNCGKYGGREVIDVSTRLANLPAGKAGKEKKKNKEAKNKK
ncbi:MAG: 50S ribosomal protein L32 [Patescibacteria group bacterium]